MTLRPRFRAATAVVGCLAIALFLDACADSSSRPTEPNPAAPAPVPAPAPSATPMPTESDLVIEIVAENGNMSFVPASASVQVGQRVRWHNAHVLTHTATQDGGGFDTGFIAPGATSPAITIATPGTLGYHCRVHPNMVGSVRLAQ